MCSLAASNDLCVATALLCKRLCTEYVDPAGLEALVACRLIALDKCPGICPICVGECLRRLLGRPVVQCTKMEFLRAIGDQQLCVSHMAGYKAVLHTVTDIFETDEYEAMLFVYALKVFNSINCQNIQVIFPFLAPMIINTYRMSSCLFIDAESIMSREGVTQGNPLAMAFYAIATILLIESFSNTRFRSGMLMMLQVLASYPVCVHGGPRSANLAQHLNTF